MMKNKRKKDIERQAKILRSICFSILENIPQEMSNVSSVLEVLTATNKLITFLENE